MLLCEQILNDNAHDALEVLAALALKDVEPVLDIHLDLVVLEARKRVCQQIPSILGSLGLDEPVLDIEVAKRVEAVDEARDALEPFLQSGP